MRRTAPSIASVLAAALVLFAAALPAHAQLSFAASAGNLHYTLTDLAPDDGIAPSLQFAPPVGNTLNGLLDAAAHGSTAWNWSGESSTLDPAVVNHDWADAHIGLGFDGKGVVAAATLAPEAGSYMATVQAQGGGGFTLTPHTRVTFTVDAAIDLDLQDNPALRGDALAWAGLAIDHPDNGGRILGPDAPGLSGMWAGVGNDDWLANAWHSGFTGSESASWDNDSADPGTGFVMYVAAGRGTLTRVDVPPVPEPGEWAMLAAGLLLLGSAARCGRQRRMRRARLLPCALAGVAALGAALPAQAQVSAAATVGNLRYTLADLAPGDGVNPNAVFSPAPAAELIGKLTVQQDGGPTSQWFDAPYVDQFTLLERGGRTAAQTALAFDGRTLFAIGGIAPGVQGKAEFDEQALTPWKNFLLSPHTRITFTADAALDLTLDDGPGTQAYGGGAALIEMNHTDGPNSGMVNPLSDVISGYVGADGFRFNGAAQAARTLGISWANDNDTWESGTVSLWANAYGAAGSRVAVPVPEPGEWAMLALGGIMLAARRRIGSNRAIATGALA